MGGGSTFSVSWDLFVLGDLEDDKEFRAKRCLFENIQFPALF
jgi:hypothetical protein